MTINTKSEHIWQNLICLIVLSVGCISYSVNPKNDFIFVLPIIMNFFLILRYFSLVPVSVFLIFTLPYLYVPKFFFIDNLNISYWPAYQSAEAINQLVVLALVFFFFFQLFLGGVNKNINSHKVYLGIFRNKFFLAVFILGLVLILIYGLQGDTILSGASYGAESASKSTLHEYFIALFLIVLFFTPAEYRVVHKFLVCVFIIYVLKSFLYGGRVEVMMISLLVSYVYLNFFFRRKVYLYLTMSLAYIFVTFVGNVRADPSVLFSLESINLQLFLSSSPSGLSYISSQFGDVYQSSLRIVGLSEDGFIPWLERLQSFLLVIFGVFIPSSLMPPLYNLPSYLQGVAGSGGGGLLYAHAYVWLGIFGPALFGAFIGFSLNLFYRYNNHFINIYVLMLLITFPRWFAYYPVVLFKMCVLVVLVFSFFRFLKFILSKSKS